MRCKPSSFKEYMIDVFIHYIPRAFHKDRENKKRVPGSTVLQSIFFMPMQMSRSPTSLPFPSLVCHAHSPPHPALPSSSSQVVTLKYLLQLSCIKTHTSQAHGFHGAGGGGGVGNIGGTAENIVFLSILALPSPDKATSAATNPAFPARVGSV